MSETNPAATAAAEAAPHRYTAALAAEIEARWQDFWDAEGTYAAPNPSGDLSGDPETAARPKKFIMDMFPYPSGAGLHVGHPLGYIATDVFARFQRMTGHNVLHTLGFDAFGLPAEQYAVQTGTHPRVSTEANMENMKSQLRRLGLGHDKRRSFATIDPEYYKWTQWIFLQIFNSWYDEEAERAARSPSWSSCSSPVSAASPAAAPERADRGGARRRPGRVPPGLRLRRAGQLVPRSGHRAGQRGGHRRGPLRARQLPRLQGQAAPVEHADHGLCRPPP
ncbi:hypothetical protein GCM10023238_28230 [Streptomyces heliomycini]